MNKLCRYGVSLLVTIALILLGGCVSAPKYKGLKTDHFNGREFVNSLPSDKSIFEIYKASRDFFKNRSQWPLQVEVNQRKVPTYQQGTISATFIGHATFLIRVNGINVLTDPMFSDRAGPIKPAVGPSRVRKPGVRLEDLPTIDVILISHNHYDHLDEVSIRRIFENQFENPPLILAPLGNKALFKQWDIQNALDMDWEDETNFKGTDIKLVETRHRSGRGPTDQMKTLWGGFVIESSLGAIYFAGDTAYGPHFKHTSAHSSPIRLALLPIGAFEPEWFMDAVHLNPDQAVQAHLDLQSELSIGMHFGTFELTIEPIDAPLKGLKKARQKHGVDAEKFITIEFGETVNIQ